MSIEELVKLIPPPVDRLPSKILMNCGMMQKLGLVTISRPIIAICQEYTVPAISCMVTSGFFAQQHQEGDTLRPWKIFIRLLGSGRNLHLKKYRLIFILNDLDC